MGAEGSYEHLRIERDGDVLRLVIDVANDPMNLVTPELHDDLVAVVSRLRSHPDARAVMLSAEGRAFSAGGDIERLMPGMQDSSKRERIRLHTHQLLVDLLDIPMPVVVAVQGHAVGLAASLVLLCDVIVMSRKAKLIDPHITIGIVPGDGGAVAWPLTLGHVLAKRYLLTGDPLPAEEAHRLGLVTELADPEEVGDVALAWAHRLAAGPPLALRYTKQAINGLLRRDALQALELSTSLEMLTFATEDHREALAAWRERREPRFTGR
jgi:enoyl-CoA hydratase